MLNLRRRRVLFGFLVSFAVLVLLTLAAAGTLALRLNAGPLVVDLLKAPLVAALEDGIGHGYRFSIGETLLDKGQTGPALILENVSIKDATGRTVVAAPKAQVELDLLALAFGSVRPTRFDLVDLDLRFQVQTDGTVAISAGTDVAQSLPITLAPSPPAPAADPAGEAAPPTPVRLLGSVVAATIDAATNAESPLGALVRLGIARGRLVVDDQTRHQTTTFDGFDLSFDKDADGHARLSIGAKGPSGRWSGIAKATGGEGKERSLDVELHDLSLPEIMLAAGLRYLPFDSDIPLSAKLHFVLGPDSALQSANGRFEGGAGHFHLDDPDHRPTLIDEVAGDFRLDPATHEILLGPLQFFAQDTHLTFSGAVKPPSAEDTSWMVALKGSGVFAPQTKADKPMVVDSAEVAIRYDPVSRSVTFDRVTAKGPEVDVALTGAATTGDDSSLKLKIVNGAPMPMRSILPLWPNFIAFNLRRWVVQHLLGGTLEAGSLALNLDAAGLAASHVNKPIPNDALALDLAVRDVRLDLLAGAPPLVGVTGKGRISGRTTTFSDMRAAVDVGPGRRLSLSDLTFSVPDTTIKPTPSTMVGRLTGSTEALTELVTRESLRPYTHVPADLPAVRGDVDATVHLDFRLSAPADDRPVITATGQVNNFVLDKAVGDEKLESPSLAVSLDPSALHAKGDVRLFGTAASLDLKKALTGPGEAVLTATLDEAFRAKRGMSFGSALTGPIQARVVAPIGQDETPKVQVTLDLTRAGIDGLLPGFVKAPGKSGKLTCTVARRQDLVTCDQLALDAGTASARGSAEFTAGGEFVSAKLTQARLSAGDDMRIDAARAGEGTKVTIRAGSLNLRPFLQSMFGSNQGSAPSSKDVDLDLRAQSVTGQNGQTMSGMDLKYVRRGSLIRQMQLSGRMGRAPLVATMGSGDGGALSLSSGDAGALLSFIDLYKRMEGGSLAANIRLGNNTQSGAIAIRDFVVRDEPALRRLTSEAVAPDTPERPGRTGAARKVDPASVAFKRLQTTFERGGGLITLRDTVASGQDIGATIEGTMDFARNRVNLHGTFVPAYTVNNFFSNIPLVGPILGGGENEGLFGINYKVTGAMNAPVLSVNPLSAIAPGFLRQIFGAIDNAGTFNPAPNEGQPLSLAPDVRQ